jgi:biopolymer transport protein TolR
MRAESGAPMLRKSRTSPKLFSDFNTIQFASVMGLVVFVVLLMFMTAPIEQHSPSVDLPTVLHPISMPGANREDAMMITVTRDGKAFFGSERISFVDLSGKIQNRLKDREVERKIYVKADFHARWGDVKLALDGVRSAGLSRVAFVAYEKRLPKLSR